MNRPNPSEMDIKVIISSSCPVILNTNKNQLRKKIPCLKIINIYKSNNKILQILILIFKTLLYFMKNTEKIAHLYFCYQKKVELRAHPVCYSFKRMFNQLFRKITVITKNSRKSTSGAKRQDVVSTDPLRVRFH